MSGHVVINSKDQSVLCRHCGATIPMPLGRFSWVIAVTSAFEAEHKKCKEGDRDDGRTGFAK